MTSLRDVRLHLIESLDDVLAFKEWLGLRRPYDAIAVDTETTGLTVGSDIVRLVQIGDDHHGWAAAWTNEVGLEGRFIPGWGGAIMNDIATSWQGDILMHNAKYDVGMMDFMNVKVKRGQVKDTAVMAHIMAPHMSRALKNVASRLVDGSSSQAQAELEKNLSHGGGGWTWGTVPIDHQPYWTYGALDPVLTYKIFMELWPQVQADAPKAFDLENQVQWTILNMERYGAHVDQPFAAAKFVEFTRFVDEISEWVEKEYGIKPGSNPAVVRILQEAGFEFSKATAAGAVALDKEVLGDIDHPLAKAVLERRQIQKLASTYLKHFAEDVDEDSLLHPSINTLGARTSRMSMSDPNLQNLPRKNVVNPAADVVRTCITAREGNTMLMCDFDQVEMRTLADTAQEQKMIAAFKGPEDFFVALAKMIYDDPSIVKSDPRRQVTKNAGYATIYGAGVEKFGATAGISYDQAYRVRKRWDELFPGVVKFQRAVIDTAVSRRAAEGTPYVRCPITGRRQVADPGKEYALVNFLIQGAAAAIFKTKLLQLDAAGLGEWMIVPVHDEIILDVPNEHVPDAVRALESIMNDDQMLTVPLSASVSYGTSWGSKTAWSWDESN
jgi:DNA polymerase-1